VNNIAKIITSISIAALLCNCSNPEINDMSEQNRTEFAQNLLANINSDASFSKKEATNSLVRSAVSVSQSLRKLAEIEKAVHPEATLPAAPSAAKIGMANLAAVNWNGPAEPLLSQLAASSHYKFRSIGKKPTLPLLVAINCKNHNIVEIIRDIDFQIQKNAAIVIMPKQKLVELRYKD